MAALQTTMMALFTLTGKTTEALASADASAASLLLPMKVNHKNSKTLKPDCLKPLFTLPHFF